MTNDERKDMERRQETTERLSRYVRSRLLAEELGVDIVFMNFETGMAILNFKPEDAPLVASLGGVAC